MAGLTSLVFRLLRLGVVSSMVVCSARLPGFMICNQAPGYPILNGLDTMDYSTKTQRKSEEQTPLMVVGMGQPQYQRGSSGREPILKQLTQTLTSVCEW
jgi:hypothetical protein